jgi:hypothetical protein
MSQVRDTLMGHVGERPGRGQQVLKFVSEPMREGENAALYTQGEDAIIIMNANQTDPQIRCDAVNRLLARLPDVFSAVA